MSSPRQRAPSPELLFFILLCVSLLLLLATQKLHGQSESGSEPLSLTQNLEQAEMNLQQLMTRLGERQRQIADLQASLQTADSRLNDLAASLATLQGQLATAGQSLTESRTALEETLTSLDALSQRYNELEASWLDYRSEMKKQVADVERDYKRARRWAVGFGISTAVGFVLSLILAMK